jgi:hypothetical protein
MKKNKPIVACDGMCLVSKKELKERDGYLRSLEVALRGRALEVKTLKARIDVLECEKVDMSQLAEQIVNVAALTRVLNQEVAVMIQRMGGLLGEREGGKV